MHWKFSMTPWTWFSVDHGNEWFHWIRWLRRAASLFGWVRVCKPSSWQGSASDICFLKLKPECLEFETCSALKDLSANPPRKPLGYKENRGASLVSQRLKHLPPRRETWVWSLGQEDPLEKEMVTHSSILTWTIPWTEKPGRLQFTGSQRVRHNWATSPSPSPITYIF